MDGLTFTVEIVKAVAWPATALAIALGFRARISELLQVLKKGKLGPAEFEFDRRVQTIGALQKGDNTASAQSAAATAPALDELMERPRDAILMAWLDLEDAALGYGYASGLVSITARKPRGALEAVADALSADELRVLDELRELRNFAVHYQEFEPTVSSVLRYVDLARTLQRSLESKLKLLEASRGAS